VYRCRSFHLCPLTGTSLRLIVIWWASLILTLVALVGGAFLGPFLPGGRYRSLRKSVSSSSAYFRSLSRACYPSEYCGAQPLRFCPCPWCHASGVLDVFAVAATFDDLILIGSLLQWIFPT